MNYNIEQQTEKIRKKHRAQKLWHRVVSVLACITVFCTTYALVIPAITMTGEFYCGYDEHPEHTDECYELVPVCGYADSAQADYDAEPICGQVEREHIHSDSCYSERRELVCSEDAHVHDDACYETQQVIDADGNIADELVLACQVSEHVHSDSCYVTWRELTCGDEGHTHSSDCYPAGSTDGETHQHTEACYEKRLICEKDLHTHTLQCSSNPDADVENSAIWERTFADVTLTGNWSEDILAIAETQLGYSESERNYLVGEDGTTKQGYTRYGAWFGDPYGEWCAMFCSFCLNYAEVDRNAVPIASGCEYWIELLKNADIYRSIDAGYTPNPGDLVFFDMDGNGKADHVGFVKKITDDGLETIEGNRFGRVVTYSYTWNDNTIFGFGAIPEKKATSISATASDGAVITVSGFLPDDAQVLIDPVLLSAEEMAGYLGDESREYYAYDIRIISNGMEWQPDGTVSVVIDQPELTLGDNDALVLSHVDSETGEASEVYARVSDDGQISFEASGFSTWIISKAAANSGSMNCSFSSTWDEQRNMFSGITATASSSIDNMYYAIEYSDDNGGTWTELTESKSGQTRKNTQVTLDGSAGIPSPNSRGISRLFRVKATNNKGDEKGTSLTISLLDLFNDKKSGFSDWIKDAYLTEYGGTAPRTVQELYNAFSFYRNLAVVTISTEEQDNVLYASVVVDPQNSYTYKWSYLDENNQWQSLTDENVSQINLSEIEALQHGSKKIRCNVYLNNMETGELALCGTSNVLTVNPLRGEYDEAIEKINAELGLGELEIGGHVFNDLFYYGNVAKDSRVPFDNAAEYADYLAKLYLENGIDAVRERWNYYLYDIYDPEYKTMGNQSAGYPNYTVGDNSLGWPKSNYSSFHSTSSLMPKINPLDYNFLENGVDYSNFVSDLEKSVTARAAGDANAERKYDVNISADGTAKANGPVAMILQVQTSWQMFNLEHANAQKGEGATEVGSASTNTELGTLYDIKHALLRFVDYMEEHYPGNNLVLGVTEVKHGGSQTMFLQPADSKKGSAVYVSNDYSTLRQALLQWDSFGNCEHVHYDTDQLTKAVEALPSNLAGWKDLYGQDISLDMIQKIGVIIGGPTENTSSTNGYGCALPWTSFSDLNSVYGIRTNVGTSYSGGSISWLENSSNNGGMRFEDGNGNQFTEKYVAANEDAIYQTLVRIAKQEMKKNMIALDNEAVQDTYVENVTVTDTVTQEFSVDLSEPITAIIYKKDGTIESEKTISLDDPNLTLQVNTDGTTTVAYNFGTLYNTRKAVLHFTIVAKEDYIGSNNVFSNVGTPKAAYTHSKESGDAENYVVDCTDTPQVNVPLRFETVDGEKTTVLAGTEVDLGDLGAEIPKQVEAMLNRYDQINGTLSYIWTMPDGTEKPIGSVSVRDGQSGSLPDISAMFTPDKAGSYVGTLKLTFTPEDVSADNLNFSDETTKTAVNPLTKPGNVWVDAVEKGTSYSVIVRKVWENQPTWDDPQITFRLLADGVDTGRAYTLNEANNWEIQIDDLESVREDSSGNAHIINYTVEEIDVPEGYKATYSEETRTVDSYAAKVTVTLSPSEDQNKVKTVRVQLTLADGTKKSMDFSVDGLRKQENKQQKIYTFELTGLPVTSTGQPVAIESTSLIFIDDKGNTLNWTKYNSSTGRPSTYISGSSSISVKVITNQLKGYELPETGGIGTAPFTLCGLAVLLGGVSIATIRLKRRRERRES